MSCASAAATGFRYRANLPWSKVPTAQSGVRWCGVVCWWWYLQAAIQFQCLRVPMSKRHKVRVKLAWGDCVDFVMGPLACSAQFRHLTSATAIHAENSTLFATIASHNVSTSRASRQQCSEDWILTRPVTEERIASRIQRLPPVRIRLNARMAAAARS